ncbi:PREDICTED: uncharacterized protein LOC107348864 [Acropora digitifera]|uniref:uncharacterized protein LOC107348864 n=1 Tax=Acropora digitifera TaxID=70779 RepID=UPI00077AF2CB|nr:PREDICTED: uncharacterized protein LOC107348864 [Acropora digitifera]
MIPEIQIESAVSEESTGESSSKPAPKTTSSSPPGESTENETDDEIISRSDEARSDSLCETMENVAIISDDTSLYDAKETGPRSSDLSEDSRDTAKLFLRRAKLNEFLVASGKAVVAQPKKPWSQMLDPRTKQVYIDKAKDEVVAALEVIIPYDAGGLWEALKTSGGVESSLGVSSETNPSDDKYLRSLAETYENASSWDTRRQVLSIMADLVPYSLLQRYLPGITEYRVKTARQHTVQHGRGSAVLISKSPRMRVDYAKLDQFLDFITSPHVILDLPFGERLLCLADGTVLETPNLIRTMIPERVVAQYAQFCKENNFTPFSRSTMLRILSSCAATVRKSLQGLDYIAADGGKAFDDLISMVPKLRSEDRTCISQLQRVLKESKQYIKADYKVHASSYGTIPDHCIAYALSDPKDVHLRNDCDHNHDDSCSQCELLKAALTEIRDAISEAQLSQDERDDLSYTFTQSVQAIESWKAHQIRSLQQDKARITVLERLDETSVLITQDWAMKWLPQKYRETQADWFGKRGLSWHISVVVRRIAEDHQQQTFVHIIEECSQDASAVVQIIHQILKTLKAEHPEISNIDIEDEEEDASGLLPCPVDGCVCTYQSFRNLERHLLVGKCKMIPEKYTFLDAAKLSYVKKVEEGTSAQPTLAPTTSEVSPEAPLVQGWALRGAKKTVRFNENQRQYLHDKFEIGQESGHKADPEIVSRDMRYARTEKGQRRFTVDEFLSAQQIQGYFSRAAAKLRNATAPQSRRESDESDIQAAQNEESHSLARTAVLDQCHPVHPIVYDNLNLCTLYRTKRLAKLTVGQLLLICSHYNMEIETTSSKRKAPYISYLEDLVGACSCTRV